MRRRMRQLGRQVMMEKALAMILMTITGNLRIVMRNNSQVCCINPIIKIIVRFKAKYALYYQRSPLCSRLIGHLNIIWHKTIENILFFSYYYILYRISMAQQRFTKLDINNTHSCTETAVSQVIESIISRSSSQLNEKMLKALSKKMLTEEVMYKKINTVAQAYHSNPNEEPLQEQSHYINTLREGNRPFSAKIYRKQIKCQSSSKKSIYGTPNRQSSRSNYKYSICYSTKSREGKRNGICKPNNKFKALDQDQTAEDSFEEAFIDSLREKKIKEQAYQKSKEQFLKDSKDQHEKYPKMNKKFIQTMGSKNYYYNKNGQTVQVNPSKPRRLMKKTNITRLSTKAEATKRANTDSCKTQTVQYEQKENYLKRTRQLLVLQDKPDVLFYKSEQCKYQILA